MADKNKEELVKLTCQLLTAQPKHKLEKILEVVELEISPDEKYSKLMAILDED